MQSTDFLLQGQAAIHQREFGARPARPSTASASCSSVRPLGRPQSALRGPSASGTYSSTPTAKWRPASAFTASQRVDSMPPRHHVTAAAGGRPSSASMVDVPASHLDPVLNGRTRMLLRPASVSTLGRAGSASRQLIAQDTAQQHRPRSSSTVSRTDEKLLHRGQAAAGGAHGGAHGHGGAAHRIARPASSSELHRPSTAGPTLAASAPRLVAADAASPQAIPVRPV